MVLSQPYLREIMVSSQLFGLVYILEMDRNSLTAPETVEVTGIADN
jgi:hypothetical protein